ncbi:microneme protein 13 [Cystoisospora suis]|uniref:Microneme protein 13 n=1 Tax=Cystoisospora suis TaxID=483139 RepID=A0A2C6LBN1_9APIC|nr:microneme protein 13 [Cystoisospora suis]
MRWMALGFSGLVLGVTSGSVAPGLSFDKTDPERSAMGPSSTPAAVAFTEELTDVASSTQHSLPTYSLQTLLDTFCQMQFKKLCEKLDEDFCDLQAIARNGPGRSDQPKKQWRCYSTNSITPNSGANVLCADPCGAAVPCPGTVDRANTVHFSADHLIVRVIQRLAEHTCSHVQMKLDKYCSQFGPRVVARFLPTPTDVVDRWRCVSSDLLNFKETGWCGGRCGKIQACSGGFPDGPAMFALKATYFTRNAELKSILDQEASKC